LAQGLIDDWMTNSKDASLRVFAFNVSAKN
jgi:hypothetical protein